MSGEDKVVVEQVEIPGMQINFTSPLGPQGKGITFSFAADALAPLGWLNERLDILAAAARRQDAFEQMRLDQNSLHANRKLLPRVQAKRAALVEEKNRAIATMNARTSVPIANRRNQVAHVQASPVDISDLARIDRNITDEDELIFKIEAAIEGCVERIPFWQAILRGEEPLDIDGPTIRPQMAAE